MDRGNFNTNIKQEAKQNVSTDPYITEDGKKYRIPYKIIRKVVFSEIKEADMIDMQHAARLQYRLLLLDPVIKAHVDFTKRRITIIYNPLEAQNVHEKISIAELRDFLKKQGINTDTQHMDDADYDYYKEFYSYAYNPAKIREHPPYSYTKEQWSAMKSSWEEKMKSTESKKLVEFRDWQQKYIASHPEAAKAMSKDQTPIGIKNPAAPSGKSSKKADDSNKGFWFHGA